MGAGAPRPSAPTSAPPSSPGKPTSAPTSAPKPSPVAQAPASSPGKPVSSPQPAYASPSSPGKPVAGVQPMPQQQQQQSSMRQPYMQPYPPMQQQYYSPMTSTQWSPNRGVYQPPPQQPFLTRSGPYMPYQQPYQPQPYGRTAPPPPGKGQPQAPPQNQAKPFPQGEQTHFPGTGEQTYFTSRNQDVSNLETSPMWIPNNSLPEGGRTEYAIRLPGDPEVVRGQSEEEARQLAQARIGSGTYDANKYTPPVAQEGEVSRTWRYPTSTDPNYTVTSPVAPGPGWLEVT